MKQISIIVPCFNEQEALPLFLQEIDRVCKGLSEYEFEWIFVDDGSRDGTLSLLKERAKEDSRIKYISFSRNFGKEAAIYAGLEAAKGDYTAVMDADLQDPPGLLPEMIEALESGDYDSAATRRVDRKGEPPIRSFFARMFYRLIRKISDIDIVDGARDFRLMNRKMKDAIVSMTEYNRFSKGIFGWVGFRTKWIPFENVERAAGETKWSFWKLLIYSIEGIGGVHYAASLHRCLSGADFLSGSLFHGAGGDRQDADVRGSGRRMAVSRLYHFVCGRHSAALRRHCGKISGENLSGGEAQTSLSSG